MVEMEATEGTRCKNGMIYDQNYQWSTNWKDGIIIEVRVYLDGGLLDRALTGNDMASEKWNNTPKPGRYTAC